MSEQSPRSRGVPYLRERENISTMAETAIAAVLSKFGGLAASEAKVLLEVGDDMMLLRDRLEWLQAFLRDADHRRRTGADRLTCVWVRQTRDVAFEAEDALDEFVRKVSFPFHPLLGCLS